MQRRRVDDNEHVQLPGPVVAIVDERLKPIERGICELNGMDVKMYGRSAYLQGWQDCADAYERRKTGESLTNVGGDGI